jgi:hypothetical protein
VNPSNPYSANLRVDLINLNPNKKLQRVEFYPRWCSDGVAFDSLEEVELKYFHVGDRYLIEIHEIRFCPPGKLDTKLARRLHKLLQVAKDAPLATLASILNVEEAKIQELLAEEPQESQESQAAALLNR